MKKMKKLYFLGLIIFLEEIILGLSNNIEEYQKI